MLTPIESLTIGGKLLESFSYVSVRDNPISVKATGHNRMPARKPCGHVVKLEARDIKGPLVNKEGFFASSKESVPYSRVVFCQRCDFVLLAETPTSYYEGMVRGT